jgi:hypothetical protein
MHWIVWLTGIALLEYGARFHRDPKIREWCKQASEYAPWGLLLLFLAGLPIISASAGPSTLAVTWASSWS